MCNELRCFNPTHHNELRAEEPRDDAARRNLEGHRLRHVARFGYLLEAKALVPPRRRGERQQVDIRRAEPARRVPLQQPPDARCPGPAVPVLREDKNAGKLPELRRVSRCRVASPSSFIGAARERLVLVSPG